MSTVTVTDDTFERDVLQADRPVLVDFWAEWCGPCKQIAPALEQISEELAGQVTVAKVNIEDSPTTPSRYGVRGIPTMMLFRGGQMASMKVGAMPKQKILEWLNEAGVVFTWHEFNGAHAFLRDEGPRYDPALAMTCLRLAVDLFKRKLGEGDLPASSATAGSGEARH